MSLFVKEITCENEFPDIVSVICVNGSGVLDERDYVPERTCKNLYWYGDATRFWCSECDFKSNWPISNGRSVRPNHCPNCGAKVVGN